MQIAGIGTELESWRQTSQHNNTYLKRAGFTDVQVRTDDDWVRGSGNNASVADYARTNEAHSALPYTYARVEATIPPLDRQRV
jgi:hypothetical protein